MHSIPSVNAGETLAQKIIGKEGTPGTTVTDQIYKAREAKRITLLAGPWCGDRRQWFAGSP